MVMEILAAMSFTYSLRINVHVTKQIHILNAFDT